MATLEAPGNVTYGQMTPEGTPDPDPKRGIEDLKHNEAEKQRIEANQQRQGLLTPDSTPAPDDGRIAAERQRQEAASKANQRESTPSPEDARITVDQQPSASTLAVPTAPPKVRMFSAPPYNPDAVQPTEDGIFAPNADVEDNTPDNEPTKENMDLEYEVPRPPLTFHKVIYKKATPFFEQLLKDTNNVKALEELDGLNNFIKVYNESTKASKNNCIIKYNTVNENFKLGKEQAAVLVADPTNMDALEKINKIHRALENFNKAHGYPKEWIFQIPSIDDRAGQSKDKAASSVVSQSAWAPGLTREGEPIVGYRKVGWGHQFIVQTGSKDKPLYDLRSGSEIGKRARDGFLNMEGEKTFLSDKNIDIDDLGEYKQVLGVAMKSIQTKTIGVGFRYPVTFVLALFEKSDTKNGGKSQEQKWITRTTLRKILGKKDADADIQEHYDSQGLEKPWLSSPKAHKLSKHEKAGPKRSRSRRRKSSFIVSDEDLSDGTASEEASDESDGEYQPDVPAQADKPQSAANNHQDQSQVQAQVDRLQKGEIATMRAEMKSISQQMSQLLQVVNGLNLQQATKI